MLVTLDGRCQMAALTIEQRPIRWHSVWTVLVGVFWVAIVVGIIGGFFLHWDWTGFRDNGNLWNWLQLLSAPVFVSALPFIFRGQRDQADPQVADDQNQEADLREANLSVADLSGADLSNANVNGAIYTMEQLSKTRSFHNEQIS